MASHIPALSCILRTSPVISNSGFYLRGPRTFFWLMWKQFHLFLCVFNAPKLPECLWTSPHTNTVSTYLSAQPGNTQPGPGCVQLIFAYTQPIICCLSCSAAKPQRHHNWMRLQKRTEFRDGELSRVFEYLGVYATLSCWLWYSWKLLADSSLQLK